MIPDKKKLELLNELLKQSTLDELYTSLHNVLFDCYGHCLDNGYDAAANDLYTVRGILEFIGQMKGIEYYKKREGEKSQP